MKLGDIIEKLSLEFEANPNDYTNWHDMTYDNPQIEELISELEKTNTFSDFEILQILKAYHKLFGDRN